MERELFEEGGIRNGQEDTVRYIYNRFVNGMYNGPRNLDSVLSYTWEQKRGGPSG